MCCISACCDSALVEIKQQDDKAAKNTCLFELCHAVDISTIQQCDMLVKQQTYMTSR